MVRKILLFAVIIFTARVAFAQSLTNQNEINSEFQLAVSLFDAQQTQEALKIFQWIADQPVNTKTTVSILFSMKIFLAQKDFSSAEKTLNNFFEEYRNSKYFSEAGLLLGEVLKETGREKEAIKFLSDNFSKENDENSCEREKKFIASLLVEKFSPGEIEELLGKNVNKELIPTFLFSLTKKSLLLGKADEAKTVYNKLLKDFPNSSETAEAKNLFNDISSPTSAESSSKVIVCLLPLTNIQGRENEAAKDVLEGIKYAVHEFNSLAGNQFALAIKNTKRDSSQVSLLIKELESEKNFSAIIGPLFSDETRFFLNAADKLTVPVISPTATDDNLQLGDRSFYQANTSMELHGKVMAQYLYYVENKRSIAVVFPQKGNANVIGKNFISEFKHLGGKIIQESYPSRILSMESLIIDMKKSIKRIEGIYIPLNDNTLIPVLLSALVKQGIDLPVYGNQDWFTSKGLETSSALSEKLTFTSDSFIDFQDEDVTAFSQKYLETTGKEINGNNLYGYDAAKYLLKILTLSERGLSSFEETVSKAEPFEGIHNSIEFGSEKINSYLNIVRYHQGKFELVERFKYKPKLKK
ncbi:MAG: ABC transporter substrate-binding protein [Ignavibacteriaceae bacterium]|nr:ABC transporter substrate-binding protein [Ignavibacteriaceae bacterium]